MTQLPPFTIPNLSFNSMLEEAGDDIIIVQVDILIIDEIYEYFVPFNQLRRHAGKYFPQQSAYIESVSRSLKGFGPKQTKWVSTLQEEGFDFMPLLYHFVETYVSMQELERLQNSTAGSSDEELEKKISEMTELLQANKALKLKYISFADTLMEYANTLALETYPEILDSKPEYILELEDILVKHVQKLSEALNELAEKAIDDK
jgi:hypothetical protein